MKKNIKSERFRTLFKKVNIGWLCLIMLCLASCKKYLTIDPPITKIIGSVVFNNNATAAAAMTAVYETMISNSGGFTTGQSSMTFECGLMADELKNYYSANITLAQFYTNTLTSGGANGSSNSYFWSQLYQEIFLCNQVIEGVAQSTGVSAPMKQQLTAEAKFMRAFLHFQLVNLYGDVPLVLTTDYTTNNSIKRSSKTQVYQQIVQDLKDAQAALSDNFVDASGLTTAERIRPNKGAATALLARAYLYYGDLMNHDATMYHNAEDQATTVINNTASYHLLNNLNSVFLADSAEAIWQLQPVYPTFNTFDAYFFILLSAPGTSTYPVALSPDLVNSFESGDQRFTSWVGSITPSGGTTTYYYPYKYKLGRNQPLKEYLMVLRLAEQYLIRAEARAEQGEANAVDDLNVIRHRAGLPDYAGDNDKNSLLAAILHERRVEMFTEWGHRWLDLKRTGTVDAVMSVATPAKGGGQWNPNKALMPLPLADIQTDKNLTQNPGY